MGSLGTSAHWLTWPPRIPCRTSPRGCWHEDTGKKGEILGRGIEYVSLREGQTGATGAQDPGPGGFSEESRHMFQRISLKVVGGPRGLSLGSPSCGRPSWALSQTSWGRGVPEGGGTGVEMPISETKAGCDLPVGAM